MSCDFFDGRECTRALPAVKFERVSWEGFSMALPCLCSMQPFLHCIRFGPSLY